MLLSDRPLHRVIERKAFIASRLEERYQSLLLMPKWHDNEIEELTGRLKKMIRSAADTKLVLVRRIAWAFTKDDLPGLSGDLV